MLCFLTCVFQDIHQISAVALVGASAVHTANAAAFNRATAAASLMSMRMGATTAAIESRIQHSGFAESSEDWREAHLQSISSDMDDLALPAEFLHQYYSQVRHCRATASCGLRIFRML